MGHAQSLITNTFVSRYVSRGPRSNNLYINVCLSIKVSVCDLLCALVLDLFTPTFLCSYNFGEENCAVGEFLSKVDGPFVSRWFGGLVEAGAKSSQGLVKGCPTTGNKSDERTRG